LGERLFAVFNPKSGKGRGARLVAPVLEALSAGGPVEHGVTSCAGEEAALARDALARGFRTIVAVGGDGTWSNVANAMLAAGAAAELGLVPAGTGCDLAKSLGIPAGDVAACARIARAGERRVIDVGRIEGRCFLNVAGFGFDIAVIEDSWKVDYVPGGLVYLYCALRQLYRFPGFAVDIGVDGAPAQRSDLLMLVIANAKVFGGGFQIAPQADLSDGRLDLTAFANMGVPQRLSALLRLLRGTHARSPRVTLRAGSRFTLRFDAPPAYETDGEWNQAKSAELTIDLLPRALAVRAGPAPPA
jgi:diacylglycerol kinase (ATP)